jgi:hypothetical protein
LKIPSNAVIPKEKLTCYLLVPRTKDDKSKFLAQAGFTLFSLLSLLTKDSINILLAMNNPYNVDTVIIATKINTTLFVSNNP